MARRRLKALTSKLEALPRPNVAQAMRLVLKRGYRMPDLRADVLAGLVVGVVALPLSMALAIAVGASPERGLYTAIVGGIVIALLGGSRFQVSGPTAAFVVILAPIVEKHGISGLLVAGFLAGLILVAMGLFRLGRLIEFIPHPVTTGFTSGIAVVIATLQLKDALGLSVGKMPDGYVEKLAALWRARGSVSFVELGVATCTLVLLLVVPRVTKRVPAPLVAIGVVTLVTYVLARVLPNFHLRTIPPIPRVLPHPGLPWIGTLDYATVRELVPSAFAIAMLGAIESLLSAVIADGMTGGKHDPDAELIAQGVGNVLAPIFGGIPATGALARTATNIRAGARSPIASVVHAAVVILAIVVLAPFLSYVPMASLAGLLLLVAWNMSEVKHFRHIVDVAPKSDVAVLVACFALTVFFDMVIAVSIGVMLAALLFMRRMAELTQTKLLTKHESAQRELPDGIILYEIDGPLFFGAAARAMRSLTEIDTERVKVVIIYLGHVPAIDATGLVGLESAIARLTQAHKHVVVAGPLPEPRRVFDKAHLDADKSVIVEETLEKAINHAERWLHHRAPESPKSGPPSSRRRVSSAPGA